MYEVKNLLLKYPQDWFVEKEIVLSLKESIPNLVDFYKQEGRKDPIKPSILKHISEPLNEVFTMPLLSKELCKILMNEIESMGFVANSEEDELRQIPEFVFQENSPELYSSFMTIVKSVLNPIITALWNRQVNGGGIQIANYSPKGKDGGAWHHDASADITVIVPLNTGEYEGGGTAFHNRGVIEPLPTGNALIFPSYTHMHKGLTVTKGDRYLLVFWLTTNKE